MASPELQRLWKLAQIDHQIVELKNRAVNLDVGQVIQKEVERITAEEAEVGGRSRALEQELSDLELAQKAAEGKIKRLNDSLYGGKTVNPREVELAEKEIAAVKKQQDRNDERILELLDLIPPAKELTGKVQARLDDAKRRLTTRRKAAIQEKGQIEETFKVLMASRPKATENISPTLMAKYEDIRKKHSGVGMVEYDKRAGTCSGCGTRQPERALQALIAERTVTCETCYRLMYYTDGLI